MAGPSARPMAPQSAMLPGQQQAASSNGSALATPPTGDQSNVRVDPLGRPTSIDKEHQVRFNLYSTVSAVQAGLMSEAWTVRTGGLNSPGKHVLLCDGCFGPEKEAYLLICDMEGNSRWQM